MLGWAAMAAAQSAAPEPAEQPYEIIVTGERTPRSLRDTASSVDVTTADRIEALSGADRIEQILEQVPNVVLGGGSGPAIRGQDTNGVLRNLASFLGGARPRTTLQIDGRVVTREELQFGAAGLWDVERIEVFRSPQTTTQGVNSIAGAIFIHSKDPTYDWEGRARILAGNYDTRQASVALSGPLVKDQLAFRAAADIRRGRPSSKIVDVTRGADPNNDDYSLLRFKLLGAAALLAREPHRAQLRPYRVTDAHARGDPAAVSPAPRPNRQFWHVQDQRRFPDRHCRASSGLELECLDDARLWRLPNPPLQFPRIRRNVCP